MNRSHSLLYLISFGLTLLKQVHVCIRLPVNLCIYCICTSHSWCINAGVSEGESQTHSCRPPPPCCLFSLPSLRLHPSDWIRFLLSSFLQEPNKETVMGGKQQSELYLNPASQRPNQIVFTATVGLSSSTEFLGFFCEVLYTHTD